MKKLSRRIAGVGFGLGFGLVLMSAAAWACSLPSVELENSSERVTDVVGPAGSELTVHAFHLTPAGSSVEIRMDASSGPVLGTGVSPEFTTTVKIPSDTPMGRHSVVLLIRNGVGVYEPVRLGMAGFNEFSVIAPGDLDGSTSDPVPVDGGSSEQPEVNVGPRRSSSNNGDSLAGVPMLEQATSEPGSLERPTSPSRVTRPTTSGPGRAAAAPAGAAAVAGSTATAAADSTATAAADPAVEASAGDLPGVVFPAGDDASGAYSRAATAEPDTSSSAPRGGDGSQDPLSVGMALLAAGLAALFAGAFSLRARRRRSHSVVVGQ